VRVVSLGFDAHGKRVRKKVSGKTKAEVKDKLKALHSEMDGAEGAQLPDEGHWHGVDMKADD
jgi:hypothetical protein